MKIYILWINGQYDTPPYIEGLFTSEEKAINYRDLMIKKYPSVFKEDDFWIECGDTDFEIIN